MSIDTTHYSAFKPRHSGYLLTLAVVCVLLLLGLFCAYQMEHAGHHITGMNNQIVWGLPHVFAVLLIVAASGALNAASFSSLFGASLYKPYARLSVILALSLLLGGLAVLVLDLGRPDRLIVAMTHFNFRSIFAWNIFIYTGFMAVSIVYLWMMMEKRFNRYTSQAGTLAFVWRMIMTTGTGSIFGFLVGRNALDSALLAPLFIALSLVLGTAIFILVLAVFGRWQLGSALEWELARKVEREVAQDTQKNSSDLLLSLRRLLLWFVIAVGYFSIVHHLTNLYAAEHQMVEKHMLVGPFSVLFWFGHVAIGIVLPVVLLLTGGQAAHYRRLILASIAALIGGFALIYTVIIGSQSTPQILFPGKTVIASRFGDAGSAFYIPSFWEWGLGIGGIAFTMLLFFFVIRVLPCTPGSMSGTLSSSAAPAASANPGANPGSTTLAESG